MNSPVCLSLASLWQRPPAPTCKWWLHGSGTASQWKRYGRKGGQGNTPTCRGSPVPAPKVLCQKEIHFYICHKRRGAAPHSLLLFGSLLGLSLIHIFQLRGQTLHEADRPVFSAHAELLAGAELKGAGGDKVLGGQAAGGEPVPLIISSQIFFVLNDGSSPFVSPKAAVQKFLNKISIILCTLISNSIFL